MRFLVAALAAALILLAPAAACRGVPGRRSLPVLRHGVTGQRAGGVLRFPQAVRASARTARSTSPTSYSHAIQVFGPDGGVPARDRLARHRPRAADRGRRASRSPPDGTVYVADGTDRIHRFAADGTLLNSCGSSGSGAGQFHFGAGGGNDSARGRRDRARPGRVGLRRRHAQRPHPALRRRRLLAGRDRPARAPSKRPQGLAVERLAADRRRRRQPPLAIFDTGGRFIRTVGDGRGQPSPTSCRTPTTSPSTRPGASTSPTTPTTGSSATARRRRTSTAPAGARSARSPASCSSRAGSRSTPTGKTLRRRSGRQPDRRLRHRRRVAGLVRLRRARVRPVHPPARRRRRRERDPRGRGLGQRPHRAAQPGRERRLDVRRAGAGADAAAGPGRRRVRRRRADLRGRPGALARARLRPHRAHHPQHRLARPRRRAAAVAVRDGGLPGRDRLRRRRRATAGSCASPPPARTSAPSASSARCAASRSRRTARACTASTRRRNRITVSTASGGDLAEFGSTGSKLGELRAPSGIATDAAGQRVGRRSRQRPRAGVHARRRAGDRVRRAGEPAPASSSSRSASPSTATAW